MSSHPLYPSLYYQSLTYPAPSLPFRYNAHVFSFENRPFLPTLAPTNPMLLSILLLRVSGVVVTPELPKATKQETDKTRRTPPEQRFLSQSSISSPSGDVVPWPGLTSPLFRSVLFFHLFILFIFFFNSSSSLIRTKTEPMPSPKNPNRTPNVYIRCVWQRSKNKLSIPFPGTLSLHEMLKSTKSEGIRR